MALCITLKRACKLAFRPSQCRSFTSPAWHISKNFANRSSCSSKYGRDWIVGTTSFHQGLALGKAGHKNKAGVIGKQYNRVVTTVPERTELAVPYTVAYASDYVPRPTTLDLRTLFVASAVPMIGFGCMDTFIMIEAGGWIDSTIGMQFGLATMTAAVLGQIVANVCGVFSGETFESFIQRLKLVEGSTLTSAQRQLPLCRYTSMAGGAIGITVGCMIGAIAMLFVDLDARERAENAAQLQKVVNGMMMNDDTETGGLPCESCRVYLVSPDGFGGIDNGPNTRAKIDLLQNAPSRMAEQCIQMGAVVGDSYVLYAPVLSKHKNCAVAVVEFREKKHGGDFTEEDRRSAKVLASHIGVFMDCLAA